jgi:hypothetical protein
VPYCWRIRRLGHFFFYRLDSLHRLDPTPPIKKSAPKLEATFESRESTYTYGARRFRLL